MKGGVFIRLAVCILFLGGCLYSYLNLQNAITQLRIEIPQLASEYGRVQEENTHLLYEIERFESPANLMEIAKEDSFANLRFPLGNAVVVVDGAPAIDEPLERAKGQTRNKPTIHFATGAP